MPMNNQKLLHLPIDDKESEIIETLKLHQVIIIAGETGSGKTTRLPQICHRAGFGKNGLIAITQPRRIAATSTAKRVAEEMDTTLGNMVGYKIRFSEKTSKNSNIMFMTDGILLNELQSDRLLSKYETIIIDEAHERSLNIDFILGFLRRILPKRKDLRIIISSATIDTSLFSCAFNNAPVIEVSGRLFPVEVIYDPVDTKRDASYVDAAVDAVQKIISFDDSGDILVFMPTERDIVETVEGLSGRGLSETVILPLFARLTRYQQNRIFSSFRQRKIVVATNIAETSITVPGIRYVVDTGLARISSYAPNLRTNRLPISAISKAEANQRKGRCGRVAEGICIRLYEEDDYTNRYEYQLPEIKRSNLAGVILTMLNLKLGKIETFPFIEAPDKKTISDAFSQLYELGAVDKNRVLCKLGRAMARLPLEPHVSRMIIQAKRENVVEEIAIIAAGLSIVDPRERPLEKQEEADKMHARFLHEESDFLTLLKLWYAYHNQLVEFKTQNKMRKFCREHFLSYNRMQEWTDVHRQIQGLIREKGFTKILDKSSKQINITALHRSVLSGLISNIAIFDEKTRTYKAIRGREIYIFPGSVVFKKKPQWIMCQEIVETSRIFARTVATIEPQWIEILIPHLLKKSYENPRFDEPSGSVIVNENCYFHGLPVITDRRRAYGKVDPNAAKTIFIQTGLVENKLIQKPHFLKKNNRLMQEMKEQEAKLRETGFIAGDDTIFDFYFKRLPSLSSSNELFGLIREKKGDAFLCLSKSDVLIQALPDMLSQFPDQFMIGDKAFPLSYSFIPGGEKDGITMKVPLGEIAFIRENTYTWLIPALWKEKISWLLKSLPKLERKQFIPIKESSKKLAKAMKFSPVTFTEALCDSIRRCYGIIIDPAKISEDGLPEHLIMRIEVIDIKNNVVGKGRDIELLKKTNSVLTKNKKNSGIEKEFAKYETHRIFSWNFGNLPIQKEISHNKKGLALYGYPALVPGNKGVSIKIFSDIEASEKKHRTGTSALLEIVLEKDFGWLHRDLRFDQELRLLSNPFGGENELKPKLFSIIREHILSLDNNLPRTSEAFEKIVSIKKNEISKVGTNATIILKTSFIQYAKNRNLLNKFKSKFTSHSFINLAVDLKNDMFSYWEQLREGFCPWIIFSQYERYMRAFNIRIENAFTNTIKYKNKISLHEPYMDELFDLISNLDYYPIEKQYIILDYMAMVEEFAIKLFAEPRIRPLFPVSEKRLNKLLKLLEK